ncbi:MAG: hypothetical protein KGS72_06775 [Cyanobacteria bacterium REEB67]|nr:hypothetical protein [Cyanobacteria bacterium REEB67]
MAVVNNCTVQIKNLEDEAYNLGAVTGNPRGATAVDIKAGLDNLVIEAPTGAHIDPLPLAVIHSLFHDYFAFAHQSGLYNRQIRLWEMFSRVTSAEVRQIERGFFSRWLIPVYEVVFKTAVGQSPICALVIDGKVNTMDGFSYGGKTKNDPGKIYVELLRDFLLKVMKIQARLGANGVKGIFVVTPAPLQESLLAFIEKSTRAVDPVSRAESIMPAPVSAHINLLTYSHASAGEPIEIVLDYPKISRR